MLAVSDFPFTKLAEKAKIDGLLVEDSIGMTVIVLVHCYQRPWI